MATVREVIQRDVGRPVEGVVKVFDQDALAAEMREYVVTDKIEAELKRIFDTFTEVSDTLRRGAAARDIVGMWISGFFGSGKSHFAKVLGHLLQNTRLGDAGDGCHDAFLPHLSDSPSGRDVRLRLGEVARRTQVRTIPFEIKSRQSLNNPNSVGEILLSEFYRHIGRAENFVVARIEQRLQQRGLLDKLETAYEADFGVPWRNPAARDDFLTVKRRLAAVLPSVDPAEYADSRAAKDALDDMFRHEKLTAEGIADELVAWVDAQPTTDGRVQHLVFVIDEMGSFIGDSTEHIGELNSLAEMLANKGKGKVWLIVTSQQDLEKVVDRTNFQPALVGRLNARFDLKPQLISDEIDKVVAERLLRKHPAQEHALRALYQTHEGSLAQLADIKSTRHLGTMHERSFVACYPFLPQQIRLAQDVFEAISGFRLSGGVRSMIAVVMQALQDVADEDLGIVVSFDQIFDAVENDLLSQEHLGASGIRAIRDSDERAPDAPIDPGRVLKVLWLLQRITWVPRVPETIAKLLVRRLDEDVAPLRQQVETTLVALQTAGYVARDEATGEWKFLNERERTIEQAIQEMTRTGGARSISAAAVRRTAQQIAKESVVVRQKLGNFSAPYGKAQTPFEFGVRLDGEAVHTGPALEVAFVSPMAPGRAQEIEEIRRRNQAGGAAGAHVWWVSSTPAQLDARCKRYEALDKVTSDRRFTDDATADTQEALSEKRKERDELRKGLSEDLEGAFRDGTLFCGGQETELEGAVDLKRALTDALSGIIPNLYPRFRLADCRFDFARDLKALLNPSTSQSALHTIAAELGLFDTQGSLQRESGLVAQMLEVITDLEDEGVDPTGALLLDAKESSGFNGFERPPYGWPRDLVRLLLAACLRAGAIYLERQTGTGPTPIYDYAGRSDDFAKVTTFKNTTFRIAETSLTVEQIQQASQALIALGVRGTAESGNAIAAELRKLGEELRTGIEEARLRAQDLPLPDVLLSGADALHEPTTVRDPTAAVVAFLAAEATWRAVQERLREFRHFAEAGRNREFADSRRLVAMIANHAPPATHPAAGDIVQAREDLEALVRDKAVVNRWADYRHAFDQVHGNYRAVYQEAYDGIRQEAEEAVTAIRDGSAYAQAPPERRDGILNGVFGPGGACHYPAVEVGSPTQLIAAAERRSLSSLGHARVALPGYRARVEAELRALVGPTDPVKPVFEWHSSPGLTGRRFATEQEIDDACAEEAAKLQRAAEEMKTRIRDGFTVVVR